MIIFDPDFGDGIFFNFFFKLYFMFLPRCRGCCLSGYFLVNVGQLSTSVSDRSDNVYFLLNQFFSVEFYFCLMFKGSGFLNLPKAPYIEKQFNSNQRGIPAHKIPGISWKKGTHSYLCPQG